MLESTCNKTPSGHCEAGLLWKNDQSLPNNHRLAEPHLRGLQRKLAKDDGLLDQYDADLQKDLKAGFIRKISALEDLDTKWYLPHYGITNPNKPGKLRRKTNAASCYAGICLNDKLLAGPDLLKKMLAIQLRFRERRVALQSDIEAMFMQVKVRTEDRQFLRFLWNKEISSVPDVFEYERHIFGARASPTCANYAVRKCATDQQKNYPDAIKQVQANFYMNDYLASFDTIDEAASVQHQLQNALSEGNFKKVKWCSNSRSLCENMDPVLLSKPVEELFAADNLERVLGIQWNVSEDTIFFTTPEKAFKLPSKLTQRSLLSHISQLYDPLGLTALFLIRIKILLQKLNKLVRTGINA